MVTSPTAWVGPKLGDAAALEGAAGGAGAGEGGITPFGGPYCMTGRAALLGLGGGAGGLGSFTPYIVASNT